MYFSKVDDELNKLQNENKNTNNDTYNRQSQTSYDCKQMYPSNQQSYYNDSSYYLNYGEPPATNHCREGYLLQPTKSVILPVRTTSKTIETGEGFWIMDDKPMPVVKTPTHIAIHKSEEKKNQFSVVKELILFNSIGGVPTFEESIQIQILDGALNSKRTITLLHIRDSCSLSRALHTDFPVLGISWYLDTEDYHLNYFVFKFETNHAMASGGEEERKPFQRLNLVRSISVQSNDRIEKHLAQRSVNSRRTDPNSDDRPLGRSQETNHAMASGGEEERKPFQRLNLVRSISVQSNDRIEKHLAQRSVNSRRTDPNSDDRPLGRSQETNHAMASGGEEERKPFQRLNLVRSISVQSNDRIEKHLAQRSVNSPRTNPNSDDRPLGQSREGNSRSLLSPAVDNRGDRIMAASGYRNVHILPQRDGTEEAVGLLEGQEILPNQSAIEAIFARFMSLYNRNNINTIRGPMKIKDIPVMRSNDGGKSVNTCTVDSLLMILMVAILVYPVLSISLIESQCQTHIEWVKNSWKWEWLEKEVAGELVGLHIRGIAERKGLLSTVQEKDLMYSHRGWKALEQHMQLKVHQDNLKLWKTNYSLSGCFGTKESNVPYGIHPMFKSLSVQQNDAKPVTPLNDRVINTEAMVLGFAADHSLPFSLVPKLIELSKTLAKDKNCRGHSTTQKYLLRLPSLVTNILAGDEEKEHYELQVRRYQSDDSILLLPDDCRIDHWWANEKHAKVYPLLVKMVQAILTCFHGPQVESSFSVMNDIIDGKSNRMNIETYICIQSVKYSQKSSGKSAIQYFTKDDFLHERVDHKLVQNMQSSSVY
ncbi:unnamed protein product [Mytilus coruscus]|uniref:HAT C-terminal dimerisation domain-containing protein n=1 Tax=Mytilus coruscus TaxID=42192 RepID=A0A6J8DCP3_MYTCO|nr:unnamed protein product [Mytilus coruscus]